MSYLSFIECAKCGEKYSSKIPLNLCHCGGPLLARYDLKAIKEKVDKSIFKTRNKGLWRFKELLPIEEEKNIVSLGEGDTPIIQAKKLGKVIGLENLYIKDEGLNPTGTFKARGATVGVSKAKELGIKTIAMPTAGNAGGSWAAYAAKADIELIVAMPQDAPEIAQKEAFICGAKTYLVNGLISDAGKIIADGVKRHGWFDAATLKEPYRIEGKKTMGIEIAEYFNWEFPDVILYPTGGGVGIIGIWKAFQELKELGWIGDKIPKLVAVQSEGCNPIVKAYEEGKEVSEFCTNASSIVGGIRVPKAIGDFLVLKAVRESNGTAVEVKETDILESLNLIARTEGLLICPEGATLVAAVIKLLKSGFINKGEKIVLLNTGTGIKYTSLIEAALPVLNIGDKI